MGGILLEKLTVRFLIWNRRITKLGYTGRSQSFWHRSGNTGMSHPLSHRSCIPVCHTHYHTGRIYRYVTPTMTQVRYTSMSHTPLHRTTKLGYTGMSHQLWHRSGIPVCHTHITQVYKARVYRYVTPTDTGRHPSKRSQASRKFSKARRGRGFEVKILGKKISFFKVINIC